LLELGILEMTTEHHTQKVDFGKNGYIEATRDDTDEIQDFRLKAFLPDGQQIRELRIVYNIQYDYYRRREWKSGKLIWDSLNSHEGYGHLQWENSVGGMGTDWINPYPDNYEPVKPEGCNLFRFQGYVFNAYLYENKVDAMMNCYIYDDLEEERKPDLNLITNAHVATFWRDVEYFEEGAKAELEELKKNPFNPEQARKKKLEFLERYSKVIGVPIPYDPRFID
ncbi:MAG TPA: hypothetical protein O0X23_01445, partial [Methanocorpusculum sp.]|nr:hypothetical protein [Methanocorpusculum sp.]